MRNRHWQTWAHHQVNGLPRHSHVTASVHNVDLAKCVVVSLDQSSPMSLSSREGEICSLLFAVRYVQQARSFSVLPRSPVRSSAVPRSDTDGKNKTKKRAASVRHSTSMVHRFLVAATDAIHSLSSQISVSEFYPTVQGSGRSPSSLLCTSLLSQTIREFGNHCLWFRTSAVRKCDDFLTSEKVAHEKRLRVCSTPL